jgi:hypothetical protein
MIRIMKNTTITSLVGLVISSQAIAADRLVPGQYATIQAAIDASARGDVVQISPGSYAGPIDLRGKAITVRGTGDAESVIVSGGGSVVRCTSQEPSSTVIENITITGGSAVVGGGIRLEGSSPTIRNCRIIGNSATATVGAADAYGAGISIMGGSPKVLSCLIASNTLTVPTDGYNRPSGFGAGMSLRSTDATISDCNITGNYSTASSGCYGFGAGASVEAGGRPTFSRCTFSANVVSNQFYQSCWYSDTGMAMSFAPGASATLDGCEFRQHGISLGGCGGPAVIAMRSNPSAVFVSNCLFCGNVGAAVAGTYVDLGNNRFQEECSGCTADLDNDGKVDGADLGILLAKWGLCPN